MQAECLVREVEHGFLIVNIYELADDYPTPTLHVRYLMPALECIEYVCHIGEIVDVHSDNKLYMVRVWIVLNVVGCVLNGL